MTKFKEARERAGFSQKESASILDVSVQAVSYWETGSRSPSIEKILQMCDLYQCTADYLLGRTPMPIIVTEGNPPPLEGDQMKMTFTMDDPPAAPDELEQRMRDIIEEEFKKRGL